MPKTKKTGRCATIHLNMLLTRSEARPKAPTARPDKDSNLITI